MFEVCFLCVVFVVCGLSFAVCGLLVVCRWLLCVVQFLVLVAGCSLFFLFVVCCVLSFVAGGRRALLVVRCLLYVL